MAKFVLLTLALLSGRDSEGATTEEISWSNNLDESINASKEKNKVIFLYFGADW